MSIATGQRKVFGLGNTIYIVLNNKYFFYRLYFDRVIQNAVCDITMYNPSNAY